jgi:2-dehydro-3-deoxy-D-arabinonate dehydratase
VILGAEAAIAGFTAGNDVTAGDIERSGPQFLSQAKVYAGSYALGPCLVTSDEIGDPRRLQARCSIHRGGAALFSEVTNTAGLRDPVEATVAWLVRDNPVPPGSALSLGLGILVPDSAALRPGDRVEIELEGIGRLGNPVEAAAPRRDGRVSSEGAGAAGGH